MNLACQRQLACVGRCRRLSRPEVHLAGPCITTRPRQSISRCRGPIEAFPQSCVPTPRPRAATRSIGQSSSRQHRHRERPRRRTRWSGAGRSSCVSINDGCRTAMVPLMIDLSEWSQSGFRSVLCCCWPGKATGPRRHHTTPCGRPAGLVFSSCDLRTNHTPTVAVITREILVGYTNVYSCASSVSVLSLSNFL
jgi:hypothetical protein